MPGKVAGEVKLSISFKSNKLFIMVMHIRGLVRLLALMVFLLPIALGKKKYYKHKYIFLQQPLQEGTDPDPYVKLYLLPDPQKTSKRKTKAARRTCNPTYNEMVIGVERTLCFFWNDQQRQFGHFKASVIITCSKQNPNLRH